MKNIARTLATTMVVAVLALIAPTPATAEPAQASLGSWDACHTTFTWRYDGPAKWRASWDAAVARVSAVSGRQFVEAAPGTTPEVVVMWSALEPIRLAEAATWYGSHAEVRINTTTPAYLRQFRREGRAKRMAAIMMHELGHVLGLDHSVKPGLIMSAAMTVKSMKPDDVAAFSAFRIPCNPIPVEVPESF